MRDDTGTHSRWLASVIFFVALVVYYTAPVTQVMDSSYSMMVSQALIDHGTVRLDQFSIPKLKPFEQPGVMNNGYPYQLDFINGHLHYVFPPGSSVLSAPIVAILNRFGLSAVNPDGSYNHGGEIMIERIVAGGLMAGLASLIFLTARLLLPTGWSVVVTVAGAFGTSVLSTASRGLWAHSWKIFLLALVLYRVLKALRDKSQPNPVMLATLLAWMYFVRPTASISIIAISLIVLVHFRSIVWRFAITGTAWLGGFMVYSQYHVGKWLPSYYLATRLGSDTFWEALAGNWFSPSRGLLIFSPFLLLTVFLLICYYRQCAYKSFIVISMAAIVLHWISISTFPHWWAGYSYGPRLMTDMLPWWLILTMIGINAARADWLRRMPQWHSTLVSLPRWEKGLGWTGALLIGLAMYMHGRGAYSYATTLWNMMPNDIDQHPERLWDWSYPQFLAGQIRPPERFPPLPLGARIALNSAQADPYLLAGWSGAEPHFRWTDGDLARIGFHIEKVEPVLFTIGLAPFVVKDRHEEQTVSVRLNKNKLIDITLREPIQQELQWILPAALLRQDNILDLVLEDAESPANLQVSVDSRKLGVAVAWFEISPAQ